eukprot:c34180_g1_i1.p1 GENE.c34180_g1_i1~~c34180_g1_i1.p1  ORF type:complete len:253 (+),score=40.01 c34180_g1_i1:22-759(+)
MSTPAQDESVARGRCGEIVALAEAAAAAGTTSTSTPADSSHGDCHSAAHATLIPTQDMMAKVPARATTPLEAMERLLALQQRRTLAHRELKSAMRDLVDGGATDAYVRRAEAVTGEFAVVSNAIRNIEALLRSTMQRGDLADLIRSLQLCERDRLIAVSSAHAMQANRLDAAKIAATGADPNPFVASILPERESANAEGLAATAVLDQCIERVAATLVLVETRLGDISEDIAAAVADLREETATS